MGPLRREGATEALEGKNQSVVEKRLTGNDSGRKRGRGTTKVRTSWNVRLIKKKIVSLDSATLKILPSRRGVALYITAGRGRHPGEERVVGCVLTMRAGKKKNGRSFENRPRSTALRESMRKKSQGGSQGGKKCPLEKDQSLGEKYEKLKVQMKTGKKFI